MNTLDSDSLVGRHGVIKCISLIKIIELLSGIQKPEKFQWKALFIDSTDK